LQDAKNHLMRGLLSFRVYPADNEYQAGYEAALRHLQADLRWHPLDTEFFRSDEDLGDSDPNRCGLTASTR